MLLVLINWEIDQIEDDDIILIIEIILSEIQELSDKEKIVD